MKLAELQQQRKMFLDAAQAVVDASEKSGRRDMTADETIKYGQLLKQVDEMTAKIEGHKPETSLAVQSGLTTHGARIAKNGSQPVMDAAYVSAFTEYLKSGGQQKSAELNSGFDPRFGGFAVPALPGMSSNLYEGSLGGSTTAGGYALSVPTADLIVPFGSPDIGVRSIARVIATTGPTKVPTQASFGVAVTKAESTSSTHSFTEDTGLTLGQFTLDAYMHGLTHTASFELLQDITSIQEFLITDLINAINQFEETKFIAGSGSSEVQGLLGNVGTGITGVVTGSDTFASELLNACLDVQGQLKAVYHRNAKFLMLRATAVALRKAQLTANVFNQVFTSVNGQDYLYGYPVVYSSQMPAIAASATPVLFGDFNSAYIIGDRGGAGVNIKILDQPLASLGQVQLLGYRRTDARVRVAEAVQPIVLHS